VHQAGKGSNPNTIQFNSRHFRTETGKILKLKPREFDFLMKNKSIKNSLLVFKVGINLLTPKVNYSGRTAPLTYKVAFYIFIQQIYVQNILNVVYNLRFFLFKMQFIS